MQITITLRFSESLRYPDEVARRVFAALQKQIMSAGLVHDNEEAYTESFTVKQGETRLEWNVDESVDSDDSEGRVR